MHLLPILLPLLAALVPLTNAFDYSRYVGKTSTGAGGATIVPNRWIVEFNSTQALTSALKTRDVVVGDASEEFSVHEHVYRQLRERGIPYTVLQTYSSGVLTGASLEVQGADILQVAQLSGVTNVLPVHTIQRPGPWVANPWSSDPASTTSGKDLWKRKKEDKDQKDKKPKPSTSAGNGGANATVTATPIVNSTASATGSAAVTQASTASSPSATLTTPSSIPFSASQLAQIGADKVQAEGNYGAGVKVAVIDSGVDYTHPALGGCFGPGCKIAGGYDYVGDDFDGTGTPQPDSDPLDQCYGHGTFIAGVIGASLPNPYNVSGVAPQASQYHYRVLSCSGSTTDDIVAQAMNDAFTQGADVINLSVGEISSWTESMLSVVASRISAQGVSVVVSAGNEGYDGDFYNESPASGAMALSVGSTDSAIYPAEQALVSGGRPITYFSLRPLATGTFPLVAFGTSPNNEDACPVPSNSLDLANSVLVIQLSTDPSCSMLTQARALYGAGARRVLAIAPPNTAPAYAGGFPFAYAQVNNSDGQYLLQQIAAGNANITFGFYPIAVPNTYTGGFRSVFSALGPTNDLYLKPQLVAPGGNVVSTISMSLVPDGYSASSGTSFSTPFVTGSIALYLAAKGGRGQNSPAAILNALEGTSKPFGTSSTDSSIASAVEQGSGSINIYNAIHAGFTLSPSELLVNDTANARALQYVTVKNTGNSRVTYKFSHIPADTIYSFNSGSYESAYSPVPRVGNAASVALFPPVLSLGAGQTGVVGLYISPPGGLDSSRLPVYSGFIQVQPSSGGTLQTIPYMGVAQAMRNVPVLDSTAFETGTALPDIVDSNGDVVTAPQTFTIANGDAPTVMYRLWAGTRALYIDLVASNETSVFQPTIAHQKRGNGNGNSNGNGLAGIFSSANWFLDHLFGGKHGGGGSSSSFAKVPIIGNVYAAAYLARNSGQNPAYDDGNELYSFAFAGTFTDGSTVPNGDYRFLVRALRITGNPGNENDYDSWLSGVFTIKQ